MIFSTVNKIPEFVLEKLTILFQLLTERKFEFEAFAGKVTDKQLKRTVLSLAQETSQYATELSGQLDTMRGNIKSANNMAGRDADVLPVPETAIMISAANDILKSCEVSERKMITAYRNILNEPFLHDNLRKLIRCHLNGITHAFMQLKLLNASLHT